MKDFAEFESLWNGEAFEADKKALMDGIKKELESEDVDEKTATILADLRYRYRVNLLMLRKYHEWTSS